MSASVDPGRGPGLLELLHIDVVSDGLYRAPTVMSSPYPTYGGQLVAQALYAAGATVDKSRRVHSLHAYFLTAGNPGMPLDLQVTCDRDGGTYSARRVTATQRGVVVMTLAASFSSLWSNGANQLATIPDVPGPQSGKPLVVARARSFEGRSTVQDFAHDQQESRFWARCLAGLGDDPLLNASALAYVSDSSSGVAWFDTASHSAGPSLDHAVWFHGDCDPSSWFLMDLLPQTVGAGRGWYTGNIFDQSGRLLASLAQQTLTTRGAREYHPHGRLA